VERAVGIRHRSPFVLEAIRLETGPCLARQDAPPSWSDADDATGFLPPTPTHPHTHLVSECSLFGREEELLILLFESEEGLVFGASAEVTRLTVDQMDRLQGSRIEGYTSMYGNKRSKWMA